MNAQIIETLSIINTANNHFGWVNLTEVFKDLKGLNFALALVEKGYVVILQDADKERYRLNGSDAIYGRLSTKGKELLQNEAVKHGNKYFTFKYKLIYFSFALGLLLLNAVTQKEANPIIPQLIISDSLKIELDSAIKSRLKQVDTIKSQNIND